MPMATVTKRRGVEPEGCPDVVMLVWKFFGKVIILFDVGDCQICCRRCSSCGSFPLIVIPNRILDNNVNIVDTCRDSPSAIKISVNELDYWSSAGISVLE